VRRRTRSQDGWFLYNFVTFWRFAKPVKQSPIAAKGCSADVRKDKLNKYKLTNVLLQKKIKSVYSPVCHLHVDLQVQEDTSTKTSSHTNTETHSNTRDYRTQYTNLKHTRARVLSLFDFNSVFQDDIAFSRNHAACTSNKQTHTNPTAAPLPLTRCAVLRHKREPSSVATTTFYSRAWVLRGRLIIVARLIPFFFTKSFARKERNHKTAAIDFEFFKRLMFLL